MYLWKYWRDSRVVLGTAIAALTALMALSFKGQHGNGIQNPHEYAGVIYILLFVTAGPLALFAWAMGSFGTGRSLGEGAGAFLLTRPRRRSWFVWRDWGAGLVFVTVFVVLTHAIEASALYRGLQVGGAPASRIFLHDGPGYTSLVRCLSLNAISIILFCGLVFGVVYLSTIVLKNALGIIVGAGTLAGYVILSALLEHYAGIKLPDLLLRVFIQLPGDRIPSVVNSLGISMAVRTGVLLLFPIAAQLVLENRDI